jgi:putative ubiquitin-RnfH superfamily antitoxin RatB of RatAB toxin-antitoxin module
MSAVADAQPRVEVVYALPDRQAVVTVALPAAGLTALQAVERSGLLDQFRDLREKPLVLGVCGVACTHDRPLRDRDRVEIYRPLKVDPRAQRRQRAVANPLPRGPKRR